MRFPRPKRRWFQFSLRTIFIVMTLLALWLGVITHRARQQRRAVEAIERVYGWVRYDYEDRGDAQPPGPAWLRRLIGEDYFRSVTAVYLDCRQITDAGLMHLEGLTSLVRLYLDDTQITGPGLEHLKGLTKLIHLDLHGTQITDAGLEHVSGLTNLEFLSLEYTQITDASLEHLEGLSSLVELYLHGTQITDAGIEQLQKTLPDPYIRD